MHRKAGEGQAEALEPTLQATVWPHLFLAVPMKRSAIRGQMLGLGWGLTVRATEGEAWGRHPSRPTPVSACRETTP